MKRQTSNSAFLEMVRKGWIKGQQKRVLMAIIAHGPGTSREIIERANRSIAPLGPNINLVRARFTELHARGLVDSTERRRCKISGCTAHVWRFINVPRDRPPLALEPWSKGAQVRRLATRLLRLIGTPGPRGLECQVKNLRSQAMTLGVPL